MQIVSRRKVVRYLLFAQDHCPQEICPSEIAFAQSDTGFFHEIPGRERFACTQSSGDGDSRRRHHFSLHVAGTERDPVCPGDVQNCRNGNGEIAMLAVDKTGAFGQSGDDAVRDSEIVDENRGGDNVRDGVDGADFVEMHFADRAAVRFRFRLRDNAEDLAGEFPRAVRHFSPVDHFVYIRQIPVFVMTMVMTVITVVMVMLSLIHISEPTRR